MVDEAHKAQGDFAYCLVVRQLAAATRHFRVLALSATPGGTLLILIIYYGYYYYGISCCLSLLIAANIEQVQSVINNLLISHMEVRHDQNTDVTPYIHTKNIETILVYLKYFNAV